MGVTVSVRAANHAEGEYSPCEASRRSSTLSDPNTVTAVYEGVKERTAIENQMDAARSGSPVSMLSFTCRYINPTKTPMKMNWAASEKSIMGERMYMRHILERRTQIWNQPGTPGRASASTGACKLAWASRRFLEGMEPRSMSPEVGGSSSCVELVC
jgi:hypothetical protein